ncbi:MAG: AmmeMemoRadiSam system radical SAM enzyme [Anaerolineales bacterium]|nr:AmmeMemoRadiSam system radical SAM enzyme [Anaerolineales bacterium]
MPAINTREALLQESVNGKVRCLTCERRCLLIEGGTGWCRTRVNQDGTLYTLSYGSPSSISANPIEKKPFYHFHPGTRALTIGGWSCNFGCPWCQNWDISKMAPPSQGRFLSPEDFVNETIRRGCQGTSISFNEPTLSLEWSLEVFQMAKSKGLYNTYVTNGYMTAQALDLLSEAGLDAMNVDVKGTAPVVRKYCKGIRVEKVWERCVQAMELGIHLEITTLIIPGVNNDVQSLTTIAGRIHDELGANTPWHVSGYFPAYRFRAPQTPLDALERAWEIGKNAELPFTYIGNVPGHPCDNTSCPRCGEVLIERYGFDTIQNLVTQGCCPFCGMRIAGVGWK